MRYLPAETLARRNGTGMWEDDFDQPRDWRRAQSEKALANEALGGQVARTQRAADQGKLRGRTDCTRRSLTG